MLLSNCSKVHYELQSSFHLPNWKKYISLISQLWACVQWLFIIEILHSDKVQFYQTFSTNHWSLHGYTTILSNWKKKVLGGIFPIGTPLLLDTSYAYLCFSFLNWTVSVIFQASFQNKIMECASEVSDGDLCLLLEKPGTYSNGHQTTFLLICIELLKLIIKGTGWSNEGKSWKERAKLKNAGMLHWSKLAFS